MFDSVWVWACPAAQLVLHHISETSTKSSSPSDLNKEQSSHQQRATMLPLKTKHKKAPIPESIEHFLTGSKKCISVLSQKLDA